MSDFFQLHLSSILFALFIGVGVIKIVGVVLASRKWEAIHSLPDYLKAHPECKTQNGIKCHACGGRRISVLGFEGSITLKVHACNTCNTILYRSVLR